MLDCSTTDEVTLLAKDSERDFWKSVATFPNSSVIRQSDDSHHGCRQSTIWLDKLDSKGLKVDVQYRMTWEKKSYILYFPGRYFFFCVHYFCLQTSALVL